MTVPAEFVSLALDLAKLARPIVRQYFRSPMTIEAKADNSPVTVCDREIEAKLRQAIRSAFPSHGILGEEDGFEPGDQDSDYVWILDPIDGTAAFITGKPSFGTLIALARKGEPILGLIDQAITDEQWLGVAGLPSTLNGKPVKTRQGVSLEQAYLYTTDPTYFDARTLPLWQALAPLAGHVRYGADCYAYALLATGCVDLVAEATLKPHDFMALSPVIQGAGGLVTDWQGQPLRLDSDGTVLAAGSPALRDQALAILNP